jgi:predicted amidohydrolase
MEGETVQWMKKISAQYQFAICGSLMISQDGRYFNRLVFVEPSGEVHSYNKRHLFSMDNEERHFQRGTERTIVNYKGWRICTQICYDLRFPVWSRNRNDYDVLVYVANWPGTRMEVWNTLLKARAIENQCYVVGVNRVGMDGQQIEYTGDTQVVDPKGKLLATAVNPSEELLYASLSLEEMTLFRGKFPVLKDAVDFDLSNY